MLELPVSTEVHVGARLHAFGLVLRRHTVRRCSFSVFRDLISHGVEKCHLERKGLPCLWSWYSLYVYYFCFAFYQMSVHIAYSYQFFLHFKVFSLSLNFL